MTKTREGEKEEEKEEEDTAPFWVDLLRKFDPAVVDAPDAAADYPPSSSSSLFTTRCHYCSSADLRRDEAMLICRTCDTVVTKVLDDTAEWRYYGGGDDSWATVNPARCAVPSSSHSSSLIGGGGGSTMCSVRAGDTGRRRGKGGGGASSASGGGSGGKGVGVSDKENENESEREREKEKKKAIRMISENGNHDNNTGDGGLGGGGGATEKAKMPFYESGEAVQGHNIPRLMQRNHMWGCMNHRERELYAAFNTLAARAAAHNISPCIIDEAKTLYKRVSEVHLSRGENRKALLACSVHMACKRNRVPRSLHEITAMFGVRPVAMTRAFKVFEAELADDAAATSATAAGAQDFVGRFCSKLSVPCRVRDACREAIAVIEELELAPSFRPVSLAAAVIFLCCSLCDVPLSWQALESEAQINSYTINKCHKHLLRHIEQLLPVVCPMLQIPLPFEV